MRRQVASALEGTAAARRDAEAEKERFKKVIQELKKKLDRWWHNVLHAGWLQRSCVQPCNGMEIAALLLHGKFSTCTLSYIQQVCAARLAVHMPYGLCKQ